MGIHSNVVNADSVASTPEQTLLKLMAAIAEVVYYFAVDQLSGKGTGNVLNVDSGTLAAQAR